MPCYFISAPDGKIALVPNCIRALFQGEDPSGFLDGVRAWLVSHCVFSASQSENLGRQSFRAWPLRTKEAFHAQLVWRSFFRLVFALCSAFLFALFFALAFAFLFALAFLLALRERVISHRCGLAPVCHASLSVRLVYCLPLRSESTVLLQLRRVQSNVPALFWVLWVVCQYLCFDRVLECPNFALRIVAQVVPIPPRPDLCLP